MLVSALTSVVGSNEMMSHAVGSVASCKTAPRHMVRIYEEEGAQTDTIYTRFTLIKYQFHVNTTTSWFTMCVPALK